MIQMNVWNTQGEAFLFCQILIIPHQLLTLFLMKINLVKIVVLVFPLTFGFLLWITALSILPHSKHLWHTYVFIFIGLVFLFASILQLNSIMIFSNFVRMVLHYFLYPFQMGTPYYYFFSFSMAEDNINKSTWVCGGLLKSILLTFQ